MRAFATPAQFLRIRGFLGDALIDRLLAFASANQQTLAEARVGRGASNRVDRQVRISRMTCDFGSLQDEIGERFAAVREQAIADLRMSPFDLASIELQLVAHGDGAFYAPHIDTAVDPQPADTMRVLTGVLYFHALPKRFSGGELRIHSILRSDQGGQHVDIEPERDMLLLFPAWVPHEVRPVACQSGAFADSRFAINCWYRKRAHR